MVSRIEKRSPNAWGPIRNVLRPETLRDWHPIKISDKTKQLWRRLPPQNLAK